MWSGLKNIMRINNRDISLKAVLIRGIFAVIVVILIMLNIVAWVLISKRKTLEARQDILSALHEVDMLVGNSQEKARLYAEIIKPSSTGKCLIIDREKGFPEDEYPVGEMFSYSYNDREYLCMYRVHDQFIIAAIIPKADIIKNTAFNFMITTVTCYILFALMGIIVYAFLKKNVIQPIQGMTLKVEAVSEGNLDVRLKETSNLEFSMLSDDINIMILTMKRYIRKAAERLDKELALAKDIQYSAVPHIFPPYPERSEFEIYAHMSTAKEVGGDFYDFFFVDDDHLAIVMADVSDKGIPAAMFMMRSKASIRDRAMQGGTPAEILTDVNDTLCAGNDQKLFVTVWLAIIELSTGNMIETNAGHEHPALCRDQNYRLVKYPHLPPLAFMPGIPYTNRQSCLYPGDKIFVYTDGVTDARNIQGDSFGEEGLINALYKAAGDDPKATVESVTEDISSFMNGADRFDDVTMCAFIYKGKKEEDSAL